MGCRIEMYDARREASAAGSRTMTKLASSGASARARKTAAEEAPAATRAKACFLPRHLTTSARKSAGRACAKRGGGERV